MLIVLLVRTTWAMIIMTFIMTKTVCAQYISLWKLQWQWILKDIHARKIRWSKLFWMGWMLNKTKHTNMIFKQRKLGEKATRANELQVFHTNRKTFCVRLWIRLVLEMAALTMPMLPSIKYKKRKYKIQIQIQNTRLVLKMAAPTSAWPLMPTHLSKQRLRCLSSVSIPLPQVN